jgi:two-component system, OmpR family, response regulator
MSRILVLEDEPAIAEAVSYALRTAGYDVDWLEDGDAALAAAREREYDLLVLDILLPTTTSGLDVCSVLRRESDVPIVMLTALGAESEKVSGLDTGADAYVTKPFSVAELVSRVRALLRRRQLDRSSASGTLTVGELALDIGRHAATIDGAPLRLTASEFRLMRFLASEPGRAFSRDELVEHLWEGELVGDRRAIDVHISNLRRKLERDPRHPRRLVTVRGVGYKLVA